MHDLLHNTLPVSRVAGIVIFAADQVKEKSNDHFALSLFRARNRDAFIKAFSENALSVARGFHTVEKLMRMLYLSRLVLWPRFHKSVRAALRAHTPDLVDLAVQPSPRLLTLVSSLRDTVHAVLSDLKNISRAIDMTEIYPDETDQNSNSNANNVNNNNVNINSAVLDATLIPVRKKRLVYNFDDVARRQLEGTDSSLTPRIRNLIADLVTLRSLLQDAFDLDPVQFYQRVVTVRHAAQKGHTWLVRREAQPAVLMARSRVWVVRKRQRTSADLIEKDDEGGGAVGTVANQKPQQKSTERVQAAVASVSEEAADLVREPGMQVMTVLTLESSPKWMVLHEVLNEIRKDVLIAGARADVGRVLIVVREARVVDELKAVLAHGGEAHLKKLFEQTFPSVAQRAAQSAKDFAGGLRQTTMTQLALSEEERVRRRREENGSGLESNKKREKSGAFHQKSSKRRLTVPGSSEDASKVGSEDGMRSRLDEVFREVSSEMSTDVDILIWRSEWVDVQGRGHQILDEYRPAFVVLYQPDLAFVRQVEVYKACHPGRPVRMYILSYDDSAEEDRFRHASVREKNAFKTLIRERANMTVLSDQEGRLPEIEFTQQMLERSTAEAGWTSGRLGLGSDRDSRVSTSNSSRANAMVLSGRKTDGAGTDGGRIVIVDTRELRSKLPMLLHQANLKIVPMTLEVADFVLSLDIGIERKSVPDLHGSFGSGRLFNQAEALCRHYKQPCLLIELDENRPLSLAAVSGGVPSELLATSIISKMVLLIQQFTSLRILWVKGPHDAAELFLKLKAHEGEPDVKVASELGVDSIKKKEDQDFNAGPKALLRSLPGIDSQNLQRVMRKVRNVSTLITMSKEDMTEALGNATKAARLYDFVNEKPSGALAAL